MTDPDAPILTPAGRERRDRILSDALRAADGRRRRQLIVPVAAAATTLAVAVAAIVGLATRADPPTSPAVAVAPVAIPAVPPFPPGVVIDDEPVHPQLDEIDDDQLLDLLKEAGTPAGLAYVGGRGTVLFRNHPPAGAGAE